MREINAERIVLGGVHREEHPNYESAYILYGEWRGGAPMDSAEMDAAREEYADLIKEIAREQADG